MIPRLVTERLILREFRNEDLDAFAAFMADADVMRYIGGSAMTRDEAWRSMAVTLGHWQLRGFGAWAVERKDDGRLVGRVGMIEPEGWPGLEIGWTLGRPYWGKGYASEAANAAICFAFLTQPVEALISCIDPDNAPSQAVARRVGEVKGPRSELRIGARTYPVDIWSITRSEWTGRLAECS